MNNTTVPNRGTFENIAMNCLMRTRSSFSGSVVWLSTVKNVSRMEHRKDVSSDVWKRAGNVIGEIWDMRFHRCSAESSDSQDLVKLNKVIGGFGDEGPLNAGIF